MLLRRNAHDPPPERSHLWHRRAPHWVHQGHPCKPPAMRPPDTRQAANTPGQAPPSYSLQPRAEPGKHRPQAAPGLWQEQGSRASCCVAQGQHQDPSSVGNIDDGQLGVTRGRWSFAAPIQHRP